MGIVGESGSGKTTLARVFVGLERADWATSASRRRRARRHRDDPEGLRAVRLPGSRRQPRPDDVGGRDHRRAAGARDGERVAVPRQGRRAAGGRRPARRHGRTSTDGAVGRPAPARRHRPRLSTRPKVIIADEAVASLDMSARVRSSTSSPSAGRARLRLPVHLARPVPGAPRVRPRRGDVRRPGDGDRVDRRAVRRSAASLHPGADLGVPIRTPPPSGPGG